MNFFQSWRYRNIAEKNKEAVINSCYSLPSLSVFESSMDVNFTLITIYRFSLFYNPFNPVLKLPF